MPHSRNDRVRGSAQPTDRRQEHEPPQRRGPSRGCAQCPGDRKMPTRTTPGPVDPPCGTRGIGGRQSERLQLLRADLLPGSCLHPSIPPYAKPAGKRATRGAIAVIDEEAFVGARHPLNVPAAQLTSAYRSAIVESIKLEAVDLSSPWGLDAVVRQIPEARWLSRSRPGCSCRDGPRGVRALGPLTC